MRSGSKSGESLGLVLGKDAFVAVSVRAERESYRAISVSAVEPPPGSMEGAIVTEAARMGDITKTLRRQMNLEVRSLTVSLRSTGYGMRTVRLPDVPAREQRMLVRGELEGSGTLPPGGGGMDFIWSPLPYTEDKHLADVFAYYANDTTLDPLYQALRSAGVQVNAIEPSSLSMMRGYLACSGSGGPIALLCPSEKYTDLCLHDGVRVRYIRRIPAGILDITGEAPAGPTNFSTQIQETPASAPEARPASAWERLEAEAAAAVPSPLMVEDIEDDDAVLEAGGLQATGGASFIVSEVNRSLAFHSREHGMESTPASLVLLATRPVADLLSEQLAGKLSVPIDTTDPISQATWPTDVSALRADLLLAALGSALGSAGLDYGVPLVDVSQQERVAEARRRAPNLLFAGMAGSTIWMIGAAVAAISLAILENNTGSHLNDVKTEIERVKTEQAPGLRYRDLMNAVQTVRRASQVPASSVLGRIAASLRPGVSLTGVNVSGNKVEIDGKAMGTGSVQTFAYALGQGRAVVLPYIESLKREPAGRLTFRIVGGIGGGSTADAEQPEAE